MISYMFDINFSYLCDVKICFLLQIALILTSLVSVYRSVVVAIMLDK